MLMTKISGLPLELKALADDGTFEGYGSIFGNVDDYGEVVMPGAFAASLAAAAKGKVPSVKMLWQHNWDQPIGVWESLEEDSKGLKVRGRLLVDACAQAAEAHALLKAGAVDGLSIGYRTEKSETDPEKEDIRRLTKLKLMEVSIVTFAANDKAQVEAVKHILAAGQLPSPREFETFLREAGGFPKSLAVAIAAKATPCLRGEPETKVDAAEFARRLHDAMGV